jgi:hypothetical protein
MICECFSNNGRPKAAKPLNLKKLAKVEIQAGEIEASRAS